MEQTIISWVRGGGGRSGKDRDSKKNLDVSKKQVSSRRDGIIRPPKPKFEGGKTRRKETKENASVRRFTMGSSEMLPAPTTDLRNFIGVVVPQGHGKTMLAREEGWIDFDSLISSRSLDSLRETAYDEIKAGRSIEDASTNFAAEARETLKLLNPDYPTILMCQTFSLLEAIGVDCIGAVAVRPDVVLKHNKRRQLHELLMIEKNIEEVVNYDRWDSAEVALMEGMDDVRWYIYNICQHLGIPISQPHLYSMVDENIRSCKYKTGKYPPLTEVVSDYYAGLIPREVVDHHVQAAGLRSYQGFGFTMNDWAKVVGHANSTRGSTTFSDIDWNAWPMSLKGLSESLDLAQHDDIRFIIEAHKGEHERFILGLILHWKMLGLTSGLKSKLLPLYAVKRVHWVAVFSKVRDGVLASNGLFGQPLTVEERELVISMRLLAAGEFSQLQRLLTSEQGSCPRRSPTRLIQDSASRGLDSVVFCADSHQERELAFSEMLKQSRMSSLNEVDWDGKLTRLQSIAKSIGKDLSLRWRDEQRGLERVSRILAGLLKRWHKACLIRDEWSDMTNALLEECSEHEALGDAIAAMLSCSIQEGSEGHDWSVRVMEALKGFVVCGLVCEGKGKVVMQQTHKLLRPCVLGMNEAEIWSKAISLNIPRGALGCFSSGISHLQLLNELCGWSTNKTVMVMEMINSSSWMPNMSKRATLAGLCRWRNFFTDVQERYIFEKIADSYTIRSMGRSYLKVEHRLMELISVKTSSGGLGCGPTLYDAKVNKGTDGFWNGHGKIGFGRKSRMSGDPGSIADMIELFERDDGREQKTIAPKSIYEVGLASLQVIRADNKSHLSRHARLLVRLAEERQK
nr:hypothetical protein [Alphachrysovirus sp. 'dothistromae']